MLATLTLFTNRTCESLESSQFIAFYEEQVCAGDLSYPRSLQVRMVKQEPATTIRGPTPLQVAMVFLCTQSHKHGWTYKAFDDWYPVALAGNESSRAPSRTET